MNIKLLLEVRDYIKENPNELNLKNWETCIAGLGYRIARLDSNFHSTLDRQMLFDVNSDRYDELFLISYWSNETIKVKVLKLLESYFPNQQEIADLTIEYIDYFIDKYTQPIPYTQEMSDEDEELLLR